ncbi:hypothetical protein JZ751_028555 [Albula glossodonta]|uniref:Uncharacterized protein n=1 Tax=Albula glossodonta TaxID=121402 RepID=A0A8T2NIT7_9TELE|nr:hypothetical protein JZ751_028555 [Albula glossodonta]
MSTCPHLLYVNISQCALRLNQPPPAVPPLNLQVVLSTVLLGHLLIPSPMPISDWAYKMAAPHPQYLTRNHICTARPPHRKLLHPLRKGLNQPLVVLKEPSGPLSFSECETSVAQSELEALGCVIVPPQDQG